MERTLSLKRFRGKDKSAESSHDPAWKNAVQHATISAAKSMAQDEFGFDDEFLSRILVVFSV